LGFGNTGDKAFKVQYVKGHLVAAQDYTYFIQNFTAFAYNVTVEPDEVNTIAYKFKLDKNLDTREFGIIFDVFYLNQDNDTFATTFFNETVTLVEAEETFDPKAIASYIGLTLILGFLGFVFYKMFSISGFAKRFGKTKSVAVVDVDANRKDVNEEWIPNHLKKKVSKETKEETK
jgi:translocon-associated protein subunit alpha